jgi:16S rRNA (guanine527-N7)-methyltransferase
VKLGNLDVSRETIERLETYEGLLKKWNPVINLVAKSTLEDAWRRHFLDSTQVFDVVRHPCEHWVDLGSGGGFPGLVIAILAEQFESPKKITLVESDVRKATFLRTVARETGVSVAVQTNRVEECKPLQADVLSARALADLSKLLQFSEQHLKKDGQAVFLKGASWEKEVAEAERKWHFDRRVVMSATEKGPAILCISGVSRV